LAKRASDLPEFLVGAASLTVVTVNPVTTLQGSLIGWLQAKAPLPMMWW
jgi:hypothetical protein